MASDIQIAERLRENARRNGTLSSIREYYRQIAAERQRPTLLPGEIGAQISRPHPRPETQTRPSVDA